MFPESWYGWSWYEDFLCSPYGERFSPACINACFFYRQMPVISEIMIKPEMISKLESMWIESKTNTLMNFTIPVDVKILRAAGKNKC